MSLRGSIKMMIEDIELREVLFLTAFASLVIAAIVTVGLMGHSGADRKRYVRVVAVDHRDASMLYPTKWYVEESGGVLKSYLSDRVDDPAMARGKCYEVALKNQRNVVLGAVEVVCADFGLDDAARQVVDEEGAPAVRVLINGVPQ